MSILGSICLFPKGEIAYIDALFLGSGAATQSGLNTVNFNQINTWQQIALYVIPMVTNPVTINTFVVFLRLYWFEKRFQHIVTESKKSRRSISQTITNSRAEERHIELEVRGIRGRRIVVMHNEELDKHLEGPQTVKDEIHLERPAQETDLDLEKNELSPSSQFIKLRSSLQPR